jgi:hypothetical protein
LAEIVQHIVGADNMTEARERLKKFTLEGVAEKIQCPTTFSTVKMTGRIL